MILSQASLRVSLLFASALVATVMFPNVASAEMYTFDVNTLFAGNPAPDGPSPYLTVTLKDVTNVALTGGGTASGVEVSFISHLVGDDALKADAFYLNYVQDTSVGLLRFNYQSGLAATAISTGTDAFQADGTGGDFDIKFGFGNKTTTSFGSGDVSKYLIYRTDALVTASSFFAVSEDSTPGASITGGYYVASHIQEISAAAGSTWVGAVPEPASVVMLGMSSLVGLGYAWRKRKRVVA